MTELYKTDVDLGVDDDGAHANLTLMQFTDTGTAVATVQLEPDALDMLSLAAADCAAQIRAKRGDS